MKKFKENKGITLIALVITIIILLILAGISIAMLTGQNGLLSKASKADKETDIVDTKEQIKLEIMGNINEKTGSYTNQDVINAVTKITDVTVEENAPTVESKKGNEVDISDLWLTVEDNYVRFTINGVQCYAPCSDEDEAGKFFICQGTINFTRWFANMGAYGV